MRHIFALLFALTATGGAAEVAHEDVTYKNQRYRFVVTAEQQANCPKWNPDKDLNPPLSAAQALVAANAFIKTIQTPKAAFWRLEYLALKDASGWLWRAQFVLVNSDYQRNALREMACYILMDGSAIQPIIGKEPL
jgi:hypothetical protein